jgi:RecA-family ATPase
MDMTEGGWIDALRSAPGGAGTGSSLGVNPAEVLAGVDEGERDRKIFAYACSLRSRGIPRAEAEILVLAAARSSRPPFGDETALEKISQAWKYPERQAAQIVASSETTDPGKADATNIRRSPWRSLTLAELEAIEIPERELIVSPLLGRQETAFLYGPKGHGKTWVGLGTAICGAAGNGARFLNFSAPGPGGLQLYVDGEMLARDMRLRAREICRTAKLNPRDNLRIWTPDAQPNDSPRLNLFTEDGRQALENHIADIEDETGRRVETVTLDNLRSLFPGWTENDAESFMPIGLWTISLRAKKRSVVLLHHSNKTGEYSGNTAIVTHVHSITRVSHPKDWTADMGAFFEITYEWSRARPEDTENFTARLEEDSWTVESTGTAADELIRILITQGAKPPAIAEQIGKSRQHVHRAIARLRKNGRLPAETERQEKS